MATVSQIILGFFFFFFRSESIVALAITLALTPTVTLGLTLYFAEGLLHIQMLRKDHPAAVLVRTDFLKDMLGFKQHSKLIYSLDLGKL